MHNKMIQRPLQMSMIKKYIYIYIYIYIYSEKKQKIKDNLILI